MDIRLGAVREADVVMSGTGHSHTGGTDGAVLGLDALKVDEQVATNGGIITVLAAYTEISALASMTVANGDRIFIEARGQLTKGATGGATLLQVDKKSGTATILAYNTFDSLGVYETYAANEIDRILLSGVIQVTGSGTLVLRLGGTSAGSNSTVAANDGELYAIVLRGAG